MADVSKISGPSGPSESPGKKDKASVDADKFHEAMHRRVSKVSETDPDEQKKRKRGEEAEEEENIQAPEEPTTPASQVTPFSLESGKKKIGASSPTQFSEEFPRPPSSTEREENNPGYLEGSFETGTREEPPREEPKSAPQQGAVSRSWQPEGQRPIQAGPPETGESKNKSKSEQPQKGPARGKKKKPGLALGPPITPPPKSVMPKRPTAPTQKAPGFTASELEEEPQHRTPDSTTFFERMGEKNEREIQKKNKVKEPEELEKGAAMQELAPSAPQAAPFPVMEEEKKKLSMEDVSAQEGQLGGFSPSELQAVLEPPPGPETIPPYAHMHPQVQEIFDRMVGVMTVMTMSGLKETTITLNSPQFASSVFFGTQIIIQEFSTAPHAFNIQLNASPQAVALFQGNAEDLMAAFQAGNYNFRINRLETGYLTDKPLFKRKEKAGGKSNDQTGGQLR